MGDVETQARIFNDKGSQRQNNADLELEVNSEGQFKQETRQVYATRVNGKKTEIDDQGKAPVEDCVSTAAICAGQDMERDQAILRRKGFTTLIQTAKRVARGYPSKLFNGEASEATSLPPTVEPISTLPVGESVPIITKQTATFIQGASTPIAPGVTTSLSVSPEYTSLAPTVKPSSQSPIPFAATTQHAVSPSATSPGSELGSMSKFNSFQNPSPVSATIQQTANPSTSPPQSTHRSTKETISSPTLGSVPASASPQMVTTLPIASLGSTSSSVAKSFTTPLGTPQRQLPSTAESKPTEISTSTSISEPTSSSGSLSHTTFSPSPSKTSTQSTLKSTLLSGTPHLQTSSLVSQTIPPMTSTQTRSSVIKSASQAQSSVSISSSHSRSTFSATSDGGLLPSSLLKLPTLSPPSSSPKTTWGSETTSDAQKSTRQGISLPTLLTQLVPSLFQQTSTLETTSRDATSLLSSTSWSFSHTNSLTDSSLTYHTQPLSVVVSTPASSAQSTTTATASLLHKPSATSTMKQTGSTSVSGRTTPFPTVTSTNNGPTEFPTSSGSETAAQSSDNTVLSTFSSSPWNSQIRSVETTATKATASNLLSSFTNPLDSTTVASQIFSHATSSSNSIASTHDTQAATVKSTATQNLISSTLPHTEYPFRSITATPQSFFGSASLAISFGTQATDSGTSLKSSIASTRVSGAPTGGISTGYLSKTGTALATVSFGQTTGAETGSAISVGESLTTSAAFVTSNSGQLTPAETGSSMSIETPATSRTAIITSNFAYTTSPETGIIFSTTNSAQTIPIPETTDHFVTGTVIQSKTTGDSVESVATQTTISAARTDEGSGSATATSFPSQIAPPVSTHSYHSQILVPTSTIVLPVTQSSIPAVTQIAVPTSRPGATYARVTENSFSVILPPTSTQGFTSGDIEFNIHNGTPTSSSSPKPSVTEAAATTSNHKGAIIGGVIGGVAGLALLAIAAFMLWRMLAAKSAVTPDNATGGGDGSAPTYATAPSNGGANGAGDTGAGGSIGPTGLTPEAAAAAASLAVPAAAAMYTSPHASFAPEHSMRSTGDPSVYAGYPGLDEYAAVAAAAQAAHTDPAAIAAWYSGYDPTQIDAAYAAAAAAAAEAYAAGRDPTQGNFGEQSDRPDGLYGGATPEIRSAQAYASGENPGAGASEGFEMAHNPIDPGSNITAGLLGAGVAAAAGAVVMKETTSASEDRTDATTNKPCEGLAAQKTSAAVESEDTGVDSFIGEHGVSAISCVKPTDISPIGVGHAKTASVDAISDLGSGGSHSRQSYDPHLSLSSEMDAFTGTHRSVPSEHSINSEVVDIPPSVGLTSSNNGPHESFHDGYNALLFRNPSGASGNSNMTDESMGPMTGRRCPGGDSKIIFHGSPARNITEDSMTLAPEIFGGQAAAISGYDDTSELGMNLASPRRSSHFTE